MKVFKSDNSISKWSLMEACSEVICWRSDDSEAWGEGFEAGTSEHWAVAMLNWSLDSGLHPKVR